MKSTPETASAASSVTVIRAPVRRAMSAARSTTSLGGCNSSGPASRTSLPISAPMTSRERPMLNRQSPTNAYDDRSIGLVARLVHGEEVREHLGGVPLVGQPVVHRHAGMGGEGFDVRLAVTPVLDRVVHAAENRGGVGDRFLVAHLRARRIEVGHVRTLVVRRDLEGRTCARGRLLEDQRDLLAVETLDLGARVLRQLERLGETQEVAQFGGGEVDLLQETATVQVECHGDPRSQNARWSERGIAFDRARHAV